MLFYFVHSHLYCPVDLSKSFIPLNIIKTFKQLVAFKVVHNVSTQMYTSKEMTPQTNEPRCEKTSLGGFRPGPTQIGLYSHRRWLEA